MSSNEVQNKGLVEKMASDRGVDKIKFFEALKSVAFKQQNGVQPTDEQMLALLVVADRHGLDPFTREIFAFPDRNNGIVPVVSVDGWSRIINSHPMYDGVSFKFSENLIQLDEHHKPCFEWIECSMFRKDREHPIVIREYFDELYRKPINKGTYVVEPPWQTKTKRMCRHKTLIQTARVAFGFGGIYDQDEAENIIASPKEIEVVGEVVNTSDHQDIPLVEHGELDPILNNVIQRAIDEGSWEAAKDWVKGKFESSQQRYALHKIEEAEKSISSEFAETPEIKEAVVIEMPVSQPQEKTTYF